MSASSHATAEPALEVRFALPLTPAQMLECAKGAIADAAEKVVKEQLSLEQVISEEEAVAMTPWSLSGFRRVATKENLPYIKGPKKSRRGYRRGDVVAMLQRMRIWPQGKPVVPFPQTQFSSVA